MTISTAAQGQAEADSGLPSRRGARLMNHCEVQARQHRVGPFGQPRAQRGPVVVAPTCHHPGGPGFQLVEQLGHHPVAGVHDHIRVGDLIPHPRGQAASPSRDMGIGDQ